MLSDRWFDEFRHRPSPGEVTSWRNSLSAMFVREIPYGSETEFRFVIHHSGDRERELTLTVLVFDAYLHDCRR